MADKRVVYYTNEGFFDPGTNQYLVARIVEDEAGYEAWTRHDTVEQAKERAAELNRATGVDDDTILAVVASSMRLSYRMGR